MHLYGGDILLSADEERLLNLLNEAKKTGSIRSKTGRGIRAVVKLRRKKWERGVVPYELSSDFSKCSYNYSMSSFMQ